MKARSAAGCSGASSTLFKETAGHAITQYWSQAADITVLKEAMRKSLASKAAWQEATKDGFWRVWPATEQAEEEAAAEAGGGAAGAAAAVVGQTAGDGAAAAIAGLSLNEEGTGAGGDGGAPPPPFDCGVPSAGGPQQAPTVAPPLPRLAGSAITDAGGAAARVPVEAAAAAFHTQPAAPSSAVDSGCPTDDGAAAEQAAAAEAEAETATEGAAAEGGGLLSTSSDEAAARWRDGCVTLAVRLYRLGAAHLPILVRRGQPCLHP